MTQEDALERFIDNLGLRHFRGSEFTPYWSRTNARGRNSCPPVHLWANIAPTLVVLDEVREKLKASITVTSSYRDPDYNQSVGGETASYHLSFRAIDFQVKGKKPKQAWEVADSLRGSEFFNPYTKRNFSFRGGLGLYPTFVHIDTRGYNADW